MSLYSAAVLADSPLAYYRMAAASGTSETDASGNAHGGTYSNGIAGGYVLAQPGAIGGDTDTAAQFVAADTGVLTLDTLGALGASLATASFECWIKTTSTALTCVFGQFKTGNMILELYLNRNTIGGQTIGTTALDIRDNASGNRAYFTVTTNIYDGNWHHMVWTTSGTVGSCTIKCYVDGQAVTVSTLQTNPMLTWTSFANFAYPMTVGASNGNGVLGSYVSATVDEVAFYATTLSAARVLAHYQAGKGSLSGVVTATSTVAGTVTTTDAITGTVTSISTLSGAVKTTAPIAGAIAGASTLSGAVTTIAPLSGSVTGSSSFSGAVRTTVPLTGAITGSGTLAGTFSTGARLSGSIAGTSTFTFSGTVRFLVVTPDRMLLVRERPPLRLNVNVTTPDGHRVRWADDERDPGNVPGGLTFSTVMPGGFEQFDCTLTRPSGRSDPDLQELSDITVRGPGGDTAWEGRLVGSPSTAGAQESVAPSAVGYQDELNDDNSARMIFLDQLQTDWTSATLSRQIQLLAAAVDLENSTVTPDPVTGQPALTTQMTGAWTREHHAEAWYDARGIPLGALYYAWKIASTIAADLPDPNWSWVADLSVDDVLSTVDETANLNGPGPGSGLWMATTTDRVFARLALEYASAFGGASVAYAVFWTVAAVYGNHGCPLQGPGSLTQAPGLLVSDMVAYALRRWTNLQFTTGPDGTIQPSTFVVPQAVYLDPTPVSKMVDDLTAYELQDWAVWEKRTFYMALRGVQGRKWRARVYPSQLQATGPSISRLWNGVIVSYTDVSGIVRTVGPPGSGASIEDARLLDPDPLNPCNEAGVRRWATVSMGVSMPPIAIAAGANFLQEQKLVDRSGQAVLNGWVEDESGVLWPAWVARGGDQISFIDAADHSYRRIVHTAWDDSRKANTLQLDAPPDTLAAVLQRLSIVLSPYGLS